MRSIVLISFLGAALALSCSKSDGDKGDKGKKESTPCSGAACFEKPTEKIDKAVGKAVTPGVMPDGTQSEPLTQEQFDHFLLAYGHALIYDNSIDALMKPVRQQTSLTSALRRMLAPIEMMAVAELNDREKKMYDSLKARCAIGKRNEKKRNISDRHVEITMDFFIDSGNGANTCQLSSVTKELRNVRLEQPNETTVLTKGYITQNGLMTIADKALIDELGISSRKLNVRADAEFKEIARNKGTEIVIAGVTEVDDQVSGPYRLEASMGSFEAVSAEGPDYFESKAALVYRMKGYTVLLQLFGTQTKGQAMVGKVYMNGRELRKEETEKLRR